MVSSCVPKAIGRSLAKSLAACYFLTLPGRQRRIRRSQKRERADHIERPALIAMAGSSLAARARQHPAACERAQSGGPFREAGAALVVVVPGGGRVHTEWVSLAGKFSGPTHA